MRSRTEWSDFFPSTTRTNLYSQTYESRQTPSNTGVYVSNCLFRSFTSSSGNGGALYCYDSVTYFLVEKTSFFSCKTSSGGGGAIYFYNTGSSQSVLHKVCGYDCCSTYTGAPYYQFAYIYLNNVASNKNYVSYSSFTGCMNELSSAWHLFYIRHGEIRFPSFNSSINKCYGQTLCVFPTIDSNYVTCFFTYSSFADNIATHYNYFWLNMGGANHEIKSCNILRNTQVSLSSGGTIYTSGNLMVYDSCILENKADYIFY
jgi:hypothetical protein